MVAVKPGMQTTLGSPPITVGAGLPAGPLHAANAGGDAPLAEAGAVTLIAWVELTLPHAPETAAPTFVTVPAEAGETGVVQLVSAYFTQVALNVTPAGDAAIMRVPSVNVIDASTAPSA